MSNQITPNPSVPSQVVAQLKFPRFVNNLGIIPTSYKDSMSYYESLAWLCKFLEETVIPTVNENGEAVEELQNLYVELNSYVTNYFDNLDVQEEINNKLDDMVEQGTLQEIISEYLNSKAVFGFDTVADMISATNLINGSYAQTIGYNEKNDGNGSFYFIRNKNVDDVFSYNLIELNNDLVAQRSSINSCINKRLDGCFETATGRSTIANYSNNYRSQIMGFNDPGETATYPTRDGVGEFATIKGRNPTLKVASGTGTIHYFLNGVQISNTQIINFDKIKKGIIIDTLHTTPYSSIISDVDYENQIIYVENGWYLQGNSENPVDSEHLPEDNIGFDCGKITFVWTYNGVVTLDENDETTQGCIGEFDICNYKENGSVSGISFLNKSTKGIVSSIISNLQASQSTINPQYFLISRECNTVIYDNHGIYTIGKASSSDNNYVLNVNRQSGFKNFTVQDDGTTNIIRPFSTYYEDNSQSALDSRTISHIINNSNYTFFRIQPPDKRQNEIMFVYNTGSANVQLEVQDNSNFKYLNNTSDKLRLFPKGNLILQSNGTNWIVISGNNFNIQNDNINHTLTLNQKISTYGIQIFQLNGNVGHIHIYGAANDDIAADEVITSLPTGSYNSFNNYAVPNLSGEIMVLKLTAAGQLSTNLAIDSGKKFLIDIPIYLT